MYAARLYFDVEYDPQLREIFEIKISRDNDYFKNLLRASLNVFLTQDDPLTRAMDQRY